MDTTAILKTVAHRPWPIPDTPWVMTQIWHELLFAHWPIAPHVLREHVPSILPLDTFDGQCWVGIVPFYMTYVRPRSIPPVTAMSSFVELNVRTYVTLQGIPGVYFFSLDASNPIAVAIARTLFHLPYFNAEMSSRRANDSIHYSSFRTHKGTPLAEFQATFRPIAPIAFAQLGSLEQWLTERYCLYTVVPGKGVYRGDIHHVSWPLQLAELEAKKDTMAISHGIHLPHISPLLHYAHQLEVLIWPLKHVL
ncbi:MAG: YqjF family protein [Ktedonobacteraceae bacterium]